MERGPYDAALADYRRAVRATLAPRAGLEAAADSELEGLLIRSQAVERDAAQDLKAGDADVRELAALQLSGGAALDLAMAADLLDRAEGGAALAAGPSRFEEVSRDLDDILSAPTALGIRELVGPGRPSARAALEEDALGRLAAAADDAIEQIAGNAKKIADHGVDGLVELGAEAVLGALGAAADQLLGGLYDKVKRLVRAAVRHIAKAVSKLVRLLGPLESKVREWLGEKLGDATAKTLTAFAVDAALETKRLRGEIAQRIDAVAGPVDDDRLNAASSEVASLTDRFGRHQHVIAVLAKVLVWVRPKLVALASWAAAAVAGVYLLVLGYGVWVGGDYVDWYRTKEEGRLDLVDGVRTTVLAALPVRSA
jgi:hypothetical protein